jgi:plastocyanin
VDLDGTVFWYVGIALTLAALVVSYVGIRGKSSFPGSTRAFAAVTVPFAILVVATAAYAVANAREEQEHREDELAHEEAEAAGEQPPAPGGSPSGEPAEETAAAPGGGEEPPAAPSERLDLTSPADGGLSFDPDGLQAAAGLITLAYENPSPVPHNVNLEDEGGQTLAESEDVTEGSVEVDAELAPGEYLFYCSIAGHREGGMEGTLTVE